MRVRGLLIEGMAEGEFRQVDPQNFALTIVASVVFYFTSAPMLRVVFQYEPLSLERIAERKAAVLDFITHALFTNRKRPISRTARRNGHQGTRS
jgi:hypothetical protein